MEDRKVFRSAVETKLWLQSLEMVNLGRGLEYSSTYNSILEYLNGTEKTFAALVRGVSLQDENEFLKTFRMKNEEERSTFLLQLDWMKDCIDALKTQMRSLIETHSGDFEHCELSKPRIQDSMDPALLIRFIDLGDLIKNSRRDALALINEAAMYDLSMETTLELKTSQSDLMKKYNDDLKNMFNESHSGRLHSQEESKQISDMLEELDRNVISLMKRVKDLKTAASTKNKGKKAVGSREDGRTSTESSSRQFRGRPATHEDEKELNGKDLSPECADVLHFIDVMMDNQPDTPVVKEFKLKLIKSVDEKLESERLLKNEVAKAENELSWNRLRREKTEERNIELENALNSYFKNAQLRKEMFLKLCLTVKDAHGLIRKAVQLVEDLKKLEIVDNELGKLLKNEVNGSQQQQTTRPWRKMVIGGFILVLILFLLHKNIGSTSEED